MRLKTCKFCNEEFETNFKKKNWCNKPNCILARKRENYEADIREKICECGNKFLGTRKGKICDNCAIKIVHHKLEKTLVNIICKKCGELQEVTEIIRKINAANTIKSKKFCTKCLVVSRENLSESRKGDLNPNYKPNKPVLKKETRKEMSERMKIDNPMFSEKVSEKVSKTIKKKIKNGELKYKTGKEHHLYKGNRKRSFTLRSRIKPWINKWLKFYDYTCCGCKKRGEKLEVHHITPFRDIISKYTDNLESLTYEEFENISSLIIEEHNNIDGKPYCKECHSLVDSFRKLKL